MVGADLLKYYCYRVDDGYRYLGELEKDQDLSYIIRKAEEQLRFITLQFLKQGEYSLSDDDIEDLKAVSKIYEKIHQGVTVDPGIMKNHQQQQWKTC